jgi:hypothetical protein
MARLFVIAARKERSKMAMAKKMPKGMEKEPTSKAGMKKDMKKDAAAMKGKAGASKKPMMGMGY